MSFMDNLAGGALMLGGLGLIGYAATGIPWALIGGGGLFVTGFVIAWKRMS